MEHIYKFLWGTNSSNGEIDRVTFWTCINAVATAILFFIGWYQLRGLKKTSKADFINKFTDGFFNEETRKLMIMLNYKALTFKVKEIAYDDNGSTEDFPYFEIKKNIIQEFPMDVKSQKELLKKESYSAFEIDDLLLGYFEDIGCFEKDNLIGIRGVYDTFDWYIQTTWDNEAIIEYIKYTRGSEYDGNDIYENFEYIYRKDKSYGEAKMMRDYIWLWRLKWWTSNFILKR